MYMMAPIHVPDWQQSCRKEVSLTFILVVMGMVGGVVFLVDACLVFLGLKKAAAGEVEDE